MEPLNHSAIAPHTDLINKMTESALALNRLEAVETILKLSHSSVDLVAALKIVTEVDLDPTVRSRGKAALTLPIHQEIATNQTSAVLEKSVQLLQERAMKRAQITGNVYDTFNLRSFRQLGIELATGGIYLLFWLADYFKLFGQTVTPGLLIGSIVIALTVGSATWFNWRCPVCNSHLYAWGQSLHPLWSLLGTTRCPHCGIGLH